MELKDKLLVLSCVLILVTGQILFKQVALNLNKSGVLLSLPVLGLASVAVSLYALSTLLWIMVLRNIALAKAYPFFALGFVLVPLASYFLFNETLSNVQMLGIGLITAGIVLVGLA